MNDDEILCVCGHDIDYHCSEDGCTEYFDPSYGEMCVCTFPPSGVARTLLDLQRFNALERTK